MELFRNYPSLCSLFLSQLDVWGAKTMDWTLLGDEEFVDLFLRRMLTSEQPEEEALVHACTSLIQPSPGGLLAAAALHAVQLYSDQEFAAFVTFAVKSEAYPWPDLNWVELGQLLEDVVFQESGGERPWLCACLWTYGWIPESLKEKFLRRVWQTDRLRLEDKQQFFGWLQGSDLWPDLPKPEQTLAGSHLALRLAGSSSTSRKRFSQRRSQIHPAERQRSSTG